MALRHVGRFAARSGVLFALAAVLLSSIVISRALADSVPPELASLAAQLYRQTRNTLDRSEGKPAERIALEGAKKILKRSGISHWARGKVEIPGLAETVAKRLDLDLSRDSDRKSAAEFLGKSKADRQAFLRSLYSKRGQPKSDDEIHELVSDLARAEAEILKKVPMRHTIEADNGEGLDIQWKPETGEVVLRIRSDGTGDIPEYDVSLVGQATMRADPETGNINVSVNAAEEPKRIFTKEELERIRESILGEWKDKENGDLYIVSASEKKSGDIRPPRSWYEEQIRQTRERLRRTKDSKEFIWEDPDTGEIVRQQRFRRLKEPYEYKGERYLIESAEERIAELRRKISDLEAERDGETLPPVDKFDPVDFKKNSKTAKAKPINIKVSRDSGYSYSYDQASFDGREIAAKRTYRNIEDIQEDIPHSVREQLIASWSPPGWLKLETWLDPVTGDVDIVGDRWSLHVTYSAGIFGGGAYEISSIHTPYPYAVRLSKAGGAFRTAWGASEDQLP